MVPLDCSLLLHGQRAFYLRRTFLLLLPFVKPIQMKALYWVGVLAYVFTTLILSALAVLSPIWLNEVLFFIVVRKVYVSSNKFYWFASFICKSKQHTEL